MKQTKTTIIFGNGVNDLLLKKDTQNINQYIYNNINKHLETLKIKCKGLEIIDDFIDYVKKFNEISFEKKWTFDLLYTMPFEFLDFDNSFKQKFHYRLQDIIKSVLNSWLIEKFDIYNTNPTSERIIKMINSFENKITINYLVPPEIKGKDVLFLHGSFYKEEDMRKHKIKTVKNGMACDKWVENWDKFFQTLPYVHLSNKYGIGEIKNMDNFISLIGSKEEAKIKEEYNEIIQINKNLGYKNNKLRSLQPRDYKSYKEVIAKGDVIVLYGINPSLDEHLIECASQNYKKLIFVWYSKTDKIKAKKIINNSKDKLVWNEDFLDQYPKIDLLKDNFIHKN
ncbi:MAG: hypothetical protein GY679_01120 [Mycoplasma sp.]|nr:hypothetical protein [Mycoplasma sp.]